MWSSTTPLRDTVPESKSQNIPTGQTWQWLKPSYSLRSLQTRYRWFYGPRTVADQVEQPQSWLLPICQLLLLTAFWHVTFQGDRNIHGHLCDNLKSRIRSSNPDIAKGSSLLQIVQTGCGVQLPVQFVPRDFSGLKQPARDAYSSSAKVKNEWRYTSASPLTPPSQGQDFTSYNFTFLYGVLLHP
jgi:hypothetical protein